MKSILLAFLFSSLCAGAQSKLDIKIREATNHLNCSQADEHEPVTLNAQLVIEGDSIAIIVKVILAPGWHIYAYVPSTLPYIAIDQIIHLPPNLKAVGEWEKSEPETSSDDPGVLIYQNKAVFIHKAVRRSHAMEAGVIKAGLYYQTCNLRQCLPPKEKIVELRY
jgi:DsbC/DsbD-like thiol-disulfide interchange protein